MTFFDYVFRHDNEKKLVDSCFFEQQRNIQKNTLNWLLNWLTKIRKFCVRIEASLKRKRMLKGTVTGNCNSRANSYNLVLTDIKAWFISLRPIFHICKVEWIRNVNTQSINNFYTSFLLHFRFIYSKIGTEPSKIWQQRSQRNR